MRLVFPLSPQTVEGLRELSGVSFHGGPVLRTPSLPRGPPPHTIALGVRTQRCISRHSQAAVGQASTGLGTRLWGQPTAISFVNGLCSSRTFTEIRILLGKAGKTPFSWQKNM